jgi:hypothetical protein
MLDLIRKTALVCMAMVFAASASAQLGPPSGPSQPTTAAQLPLSGRTAALGSVTATESPVPGTTGSINTVNPVLQVQGPFSGSTPSTSAMPFTGSLTLREAIQRGLRFNLGPEGLAQAVHQARGQSVVARSALLPNVNGSLSETVQ